MELRLLLPLLLLLLCISGFRAQEYDAAESRVAGQSLTVECRYDARYSKVSKVWCQRRGGICYRLVSIPFTSSNRDQSERTSGRVTIQDDTRNGIVTVTMKNLQVQDSGVYWCARRGPIDTLYALKTIKLDVLKAVREHSAVEGQTLSLQCLYNLQIGKEERKAWCRRTDQNTCDVLVSTDYSVFFRYQNMARNGSAVIHDDTQKGVLTITMEKLQEDDSGVYWCALYVPPHIYRIIEVKLTVTKAPTTSMDHTSTVLNTDVTELTPTQSSLSSTERTFIILGVVLGLLVIPALVGVVILCTRKSRQLKSKGGEKAAGIYEEPRNATVTQGFSNTKDPKDDKQEMPQDLKYAVLDFKPRPSPQESVYANVLPLQPLETPHTRSPSAEPMEYASISLKPSGARH